MKALKVTISGSYRAADKETIDFEDVSGVIPFVDDDKARQHVRGRYAKIWIGNVIDSKGKKVYPTRVDEVRLCHVDVIEPVDVEEDFSFVGKDIRTMTFAELQDLATAKDLMTIPADKDLNDLQDARNRAYAAYALSVGLGDVKIGEPEFNLSKMPPLVVMDATARRDMTEKLTNEEVIAIAMKPEDLLKKVKTTLTMDEMLILAKQKNIPVTQGISFDDLYGKLFATV